MEGRGFSGLYKNSSEELFLKAVMESPIGMPVPTMEMLGFKTVSQSFRTDSEELFKRWLTNGEASCYMTYDHVTLFYVVSVLIRVGEKMNHLFLADFFLLILILFSIPGYNSSSIGLNSRLSRRMSTELVNVSNQQHVSVASEGRNNDKSYIQNNFLTNDVSADFNFPIRDPADREQQSSNLFLAKAWFLSDQRMTRSRSSELRRRYTEMQNSQASQGIESICMAPQHGTDTIKQGVSNLNGFDYLSMCELPSQKGSFMSPCNSSSSTFNTHQLGDADKVSSCVSMLKEPLFQPGFNEGQENWSLQKQINVQGGSTGQVKDPGVQQTLEGTMNTVLDGFANQTNQIYVGPASREPSQSESSAAAPVISSGLDACEGPSNSNQTLCESSWKQVGVNRSSENTQNRVKGVREQIMDNLKDDRKV
ncbi:hypothetical protein SESBI_32277 [Sesbania bispinosa]|nr:hypothetical protein SESBI_32277 [Sesbania bispinosa]